LNENYIILSVSSNDLGKRIDVFLSLKIKDFSRSKLQKLIKSKNVKFNDELVLDRSLKLNQIGKIIIIVPKPKEINLKPQNLELKVIFEDEHLILVDKPAGMVVHPGAGVTENTLVNGLLFQCKNNLSGINGELRPGIVHRLDKMTSGLIIAAKDDFTHNSLSKQFKERKVNKNYKVLVWNKLPKIDGEIITNIERSKKNRKNMSVTTNIRGKEAVTQYKLLEQFQIEKTIISYINCQILTGRTHQIRVHMEYLGNSVIGDSTYKKNSSKNQFPQKVIDLITEDFIKKNRHALHAASLSFIHPKTKKTLLFEANLPNDMSNLLKILQKTKKNS